MNTLDLPQQTFSQFKQVEHDYIGYQSLTDVPRVIDCEEVLLNCDVSISTCCTGINFFIH